jgi:hypothetical protein
VRKKEFMTGGDVSSSAYYYRKGQGWLFTLRQIASLGGLNNDFIAN